MLLILPGNSQGILLMNADLAKVPPLPFILSSLRADYLSISVCHTEVPSKLPLHTFSVNRLNIQEGVVTNPLSSND